MAGNRTWRRLSCCRSHRRNREPETRLLNWGSVVGSVIGSVSVSASVSWGGATFVARSGHRRNRKRSVSACRRRGVSAFGRRLIGVVSQVGTLLAPFGLRGEDKSWAQACSSLQCKER
jgi:hypothetical protein